MSDDEKKMWIGSLVVEYGETKQKLAAIVEKARDMALPLKSVLTTKSAR